MTLAVLLFGEAASTFGADRVMVDVPDGATSRAVLAAIGEQHPGLKVAAASARLAVNHAFSKPEDSVSASDELALITLVGGG